MTHDNHVQAKSQTQFEYDRHHNAVHMRKQVINFAIMIFLTFIAFAAVQAGFSEYFVVPIILVLAGIQVILQLYSFMHMEDKKGHNIGILEFMFWFGAFVAFITVLAFVTIVWW